MGKYRRRQIGDIFVIIAGTIGHVVGANQHFL